jgi:hypothetical protein
MGCWHIEMGNVETRKESAIMANKFPIEVFERLTRIEDKIDFICYIYKAALWVFGSVGAAVGIVVVSFPCWCLSFVKHLLLIS